MYPIFSVLISFYFMAKSVSPFELAHLRSVTCNTEQNLKSKCSFCSSKSLLMKEPKTVYKVYKTSDNLEDLDVDFLLPPSTF